MKNIALVSFFYVNSSLECGEFGVQNKMKMICFFHSLFFATLICNRGAIMNYFYFAY
jgi:hypothetical protein